MKIKLIIIKILSGLRLLKYFRTAKNTLSFDKQNKKLLVIYKNLIVANGIMFDIGSHNGEIAALASSLGCHVIAVEANPDLAEKIKKRYSGFDSVIVEHAAISSSMGSIEFLISDEMPELSSVSKEWVDKSVYAGACRWNRTVTVPALTLDALIEKHGVPRFIKIDVEGHEPDVLAGLTQAVDYLSFEYCLKMEGALEACVQRLEQIAADSNRRALFNYSKDKNHSLELSTWVTATEILRELHSFDDELAVGDIYCKTISETI